MPTNVAVPPLGESVTEAVLLRWLKNDGDPVAADEPVAELETDKANVDLPSPAAGVLRPGKKPGDTVRVGETIARIDEGGGAAPRAAAPAAKAATQPASPPPAATKPATQPTPAAPPPPRPTQPSADLDDLRPSVRRLVQENNLNPAAMVGTGPGGRITKEDVLNRLGEGGKDQREDGNGERAAATTTP